MAIDVKITDNSDKFLNALPEQIEQALIAIGLTAETKAKEEVTRAVYDTPERGYIRTGDLRKRITNKVEMSEKTVYIGENLEYAPYVELGTSRMKPRPFLKPAIMNNVDEYKKLAEQALKGG
jgi:HK97 gp10 family phage protein